MCHCSNDFTGVARILKLPEQVVERVSVDNQNRVLYDDFVAVYNSYFDDNDSYRPGTRSSSRYHYSKQAQQVTEGSSKKERKEVRMIPARNLLIYDLDILSSFAYYISEM